MPNGYCNGWGNSYSQPSRTYMQSDAEKGVSVVKRIPWEKDFVENKFWARVLDLTQWPCVPSGFASKKSDKDMEREKLEATKRALANGNRGWLNKEWSAAAMQAVQRKLKKLMPR